MAFTGVATVKLVADNIVRITGLSLAGGASGTISYSPGTGQVKLPANVEAGKYVTSDGATCNVADSTDVSAKCSDAAAPSSVAVSVVKTGTTTSDFLATLQNQNSASSTGGLEIYVKFHS